MKNLIVLSILILFASCGVHTKQLHKDQKIDKSKTSIVDSSIKKIIDTTKHKLIDTTTTIIHKKTDTLIILPEVKIKDTFDLNDTSSDSIIVKQTDKDGLHVVTTYDKKNKKITTDVKKDKEEKNIFIDETTYQKKGITSETENGVNIEDKKSENIKEEKNVRETSKDVHKKNNYSINTIVFGIIIIVIIIIVLLWFFGKPKKVKINCDE